MVRLGKCFGNLMVDLRATNTKLRARTNRIVRTITGLTEAAAAELARPLRRRTEDRSRRSPSRVSSRTTPEPDWPSTAAGSAMCCGCSAGRATVASPTTWSSASTAAAARRSP